MPESKTSIIAKTSLESSSCSIPYSSQFEPSGIPESSVDEKPNPNEGLDIEVNDTKDYGIGIDCHSKFIYVTVLVRYDMKLYVHSKEFDTDWNSLVAAKNWCLSIIRNNSRPVPDMSLPIHYCIESTAQYHVCVTFAWEGVPTVINPSLAGATKRKTDRMDSVNLARFDLNGTWKESYVPSVEVRELRLLIGERACIRRDATRTGNRINSCILGFGLTVGRDGSVVKSPSIRAIVEDQASDHPSPRSDICPTGLPVDIRETIRELYKTYDDLVTKSNDYLVKIKNKVLSMDWETANGTLSGEQMLSILTSAPHIGEVTAMTWLAYIITPRRFPNAKAVSAYCGLDPSLKISAGKVTSTAKRGGHKVLHSSLCLAASSLIKSHNEMFGRWGYNLYCKSGRWKKAVNAVARKLCSAMYYMMRTGTAFSYDKYNIARIFDVFDIPVDILPRLNPDFKRYISSLQEAGITSTSALVTSYLDCSLGSVRGLGPKFFKSLEEFMHHQQKYKQAYSGLKEAKDESK